MTTATRTAPHHNTLTCYTDYKCRRPDCVTRYNDRNNARRHAQKDGTWDRLIDAAPVREHLLHLQASNIGPGAVAYTTGLSIQTILEFTQARPNKGRGRRQRTSPEMAAKILAVTVDNHRTGRVPAIGSIRRVQALVAAGWPLRQIAEHAGLSSANASTLLRRTTIFAATAKAIAATFEDLKGKRPLRNGVDKGQAKRARNWAARNRWATCAYWAERMDVIDDPDFIPEDTKLRAEIVAEEAHWLMSVGGLDRDQAAARLGIARFTIDRALREHPQGELGMAA
ncbi:hypothetical protein [Streptomyces sp. NPDC059649]|uniref:hypothetical protein n=1 Tax=Streptomyces sp. NPDC059649 TaxID=3346895 RepID=UPI0036C473F7